MEYYFKVSKLVAAMVLLSCFIPSTTIAKSKTSSGKLKVGYYYKTCPQAEIIVRKAVLKAFSLNPGIAAGLIRMHFHDCFVRGCDGSVLLDTVPGKPAAEKDSFVNNPSLRGFEVIDEAKSEIESVCPETVSCADILAFSARDSALAASGHVIAYRVPSGRKDGLVSLSSEVLQNLPPPFFNATQLRDNFRNKGLSLEDMVALSGAHSIGVSRCSSFANRLGPVVDPTLDPGFAAFLAGRCPAPGGGSANIVVDNDFRTPDRLDNKYYANLKVKKGLLTSDQTLFDSVLTRKMVVDNAKYGPGWVKKFVAATVKMGNIGVITGKHKGEIRTNCHFVN